MPGCVLRAFGPSFDVDGFLATSNLPVIRVFRRGERVSRRSEELKYSGFNVNVSDQDGSRVPMQVREAIEFLDRHIDELEALAARDDVEVMYLDFGWDFPLKSNGQWNRFPIELVRRCSRLGLGIEVSVYRVESD